MKDRCLNKGGKAYKDWGARGITICDRWRDSFEAFHEDMGTRPTPDHSIERKDNDGPYCKSNCFWATRTTQANNKRNNVLVTIGHETLTVAQWADRAGISGAMIHKRLKRGWEAEEAVFTPSRAVRKHWKMPDNIGYNACIRRDSTSNPV